MVARLNGSRRDIRAITRRPRGTERQFRALYSPYWNSR